MSIVYGNFGQLLQEKISSGPLPTNTQVVYFSLPWSSSSVVRDVTVMGDGVVAGDGISVYLPYNNAQIFHARTVAKSWQTGIGYSHSVYLAEEAVMPSRMKIAQLANSSGVGEIAAYTEDIFNRNYLNVMVFLSKPTNQSIEVKVSGQKTYQSSYTKTDNNGSLYQKNYSVVIGRNQSTAGGKGGTTYDVTPFAKMTASSNDVNQFSIETAYDYIYVGTDRKVSAYDVKVNTPYAGTATSMSGQLWNGTAWAEFRVMDNTAADMHYTTLRYSGIIEGFGIGSSSEWVPTKLDSTLSSNLTDDPKTIIEREIKAGTYFAPAMFDNSPKYWVRFYFGDQSKAFAGKATLAGIVPVL